MFGVSLRGGWRFVNAGGDSGLTVPTVKNVDCKCVNCTEFESEAQAAGLDPSKCSKLKCTGEVEIKVKVNNPGDPGNPSSHFRRKMGK
jgi:hypothetical protein